MMCSFNGSLATSREFVPGGQRHQVIPVALPALEKDLIFISAYASSVFQNRSCAVECGRTFLERAPGRALKVNCV